MRITLTDTIHIWTKWKYNKDSRSRKCIICGLIEIEIKAKTN